MEAEDILLDNSGQRKVIEKTGEVLPNMGVAILTEALIVESVNLSDLLGLVVATKNGNTVRIAHLHHHKEGNGFDRVVTTVYVVSHEEVVVVGEFTANFEKFLEIPKLTVDITADSDWSTDILYVSFLNKDLLGSLTELLDEILRERITLIETIDVLLEDLWVSEIIEASA